MRGQNNVQLIQPTCRELFNADPKKRKTDRTYDKSHLAVAAQLGRATSSCSD